MSEEKDDYGYGCVGCFDIIVITLVVIFLFCYKCNTKEVVKDITKTTKEYVNIIDSVWSGK